MALLICWGKLCRSCDHKGCRDGYSAATPALIDCVICNGKGCVSCGDQGTYEVTSCPKEQITDDVWRFVRFMRFAEQGILPMAGGMLDQTQSFCDALAFAQADEGKLKAEIGVK